MKNLSKALWVLILVTLISSCKKEEDMKEKDDQIIREYLEREKLTATKTESGLYYIINVPGTFPTPTTNSTVTVHYKGYLVTNQIFDSTEGSSAATFPLTNVIAGWREGMKFFGEGGKGVLLIPSHLGYGSTVMPGIPANSVLIFDIHLIKVE